MIDRLAALAIVAQALWVFGLTLLGLPGFAGLSAVVASLGWVAVIVCLAGLTVVRGLANSDEEVR